MTPQERSEIERLAREGRMIEAIKECRRISGLGLAEAKEAVEAIAAGKPDNTAPSRPPTVPSDKVRESLAKGNKIEAIRLYREATGGGLKEAKDAVEAIERQERIGSAGNPVVHKQGCFGLVMVTGFLIAALVLKASA